MRGRPRVGGGALLAGVGAGVLGSLEQAAALLETGRRVTPRTGEAERSAARVRWREFVRAAARI